MGCALSACSATAGLPDAPSGLTCTADTGATVRLNIDLATRHFQKDGFPILPMEKVTARIIILMRGTIGSTAVEASIDRRRLIYTARSEDGTSGKATVMEYQCLAGPPFATSADRQDMRQR